MFQKCGKTAAQCIRDVEQGGDESEGEVEQIDDEDMDIKDH